MSIQEVKSKLHQLVEEQEDEAILSEVSRVLSGDTNRNKLDALTNEQLGILAKAREEAR